MSQFSALIRKIRPGSADEVEQLLKSSGRPDPIIRGEDGTEKGRLLSTMVFMTEDVVVRVIEYEGETRDVAQHIAKQRPIVDLEDRLEHHVDKSADFDAPGGAEQYFRETMMRTVLARRIGQ